MVGTDQKKEKIKKLAFEMFLEIGYEATTVRMICHKAEIESPTLYYFFKSKKGLFLSIRNDLMEEYKQMVSDLAIEKCDNSEQALVKYYRFCVEYAMKNEEKTCFFLRYRLFKPAELHEEIEEYTVESYEEKRDLLIKHIQGCIEPNNINVSAEKAFHRYLSFIDGCTFKIIFSNWRPSDEEISREWKIFYNYQMQEIS
jgi:AcrR family transcriptional regulator